MKPVAPEKHRVTSETCRNMGWPSMLASSSAEGMAGMFLLPNSLVPMPHGSQRDRFIRCVVHDGSGEAGGWEHVSASFDHRCPTWDEMCLVKSTFWCEDEAVVQYHPAEADCVNMHPYTLHLWRHPSLPKPPKDFV